MRRAIPWFFILSACAAAPGALVNAAVNTAIAAAASGINRATGDCYAVCPMGTRCNNSTGFCEPIPCRDLCTTDQVCEVAALSEHCVPKAEASLQLETTPEPPAPALIDPR